MNEIQTLSLPCTKITIERGQVVIELDGEKRKPFSPYDFLEFAGHVEDCYLYGQRPNEEKSLLLHDGSGFSESDEPLEAVRLVGEAARDFVTQLVEAEEQVRAKWHIAR